MNSSFAQRFLRQVQRRLALAAIARRWRAIFSILLVAFAVGLLLSRLLGLIPPWFNLMTLAVLPVIALILACFFYRRPDPAAAARAADASLKTKDLFLTASVIESAPGEYQNLVLREAETRSASAVPAQVVPFRWAAPAWRLAGAAALLAAGVMLLPQTDPFGLRQHQNEIAARREQARELARATQARAALLEQQPAGPHSEAIKQALANLEKIFQEAKPADKPGTLARLNEQQQLLGQLWKLANEEKLKNAMNLPSTAQSFGLSDPSRTERLQKDLKQGDISSANQELDELKKLAEELAATTDPVEREKLRQELMDRVQALKNTISQEMNSQALNASLQRAIEQLAMSASAELSAECLGGMCDSLSLSQEELRQLSRAMAGMKSLEEALRALQLAKALHNLKPLDGQDFAKFGDLAAYAAFLEAQCQSLIPGHGLGGGPGIGPRPYGDDNQASAFQSEKSPSLLQPGRMLMEWKTREVSEAGPAREEYQQALQAVRQQASEAVVQEQIPPGYQTAIQKYFDTLNHDATATPQR